jgi:hypothetical protein
MAIRYLLLEVSSPLYKPIKRLLQKKLNVESTIKEANTRCFSTLQPLSALERKLLLRKEMSGREVAGVAEGWGRSKEELGASRNFEDVNRLEGADVDC